MNFKHLTFAAALCVFAPASLTFAEDCPANAEQQVYDTQIALQKGEISSPETLAEKAIWAIETCPQRSDVQAMAATLMGVAIKYTNDPDTVFEYLTHLDQAIRQNDKSWQPDMETTVTNANGESERYFGYNLATAELKDRLLPYLIELARRNKMHPLIAGDALPSCPYTNRNGSGRLDEELEFWALDDFKNDQTPFYAWAEARLKLLSQACPSHLEAIAAARVERYADMLTHLTKWTAETESSGIGLFSTTSYLWVKGNRWFTTKSEMQAFKAKLDERAHAIVQAAKPVLAQLEEAYKSHNLDAMSYRERNDQTERNDRYTRLAKQIAQAESVIGRDPE